MKSILIGLVCLVSCMAGNAQKVISDTSVKAELAWFTNEGEAMKAADEHQKNILMVFAGSDWCRPCIQFKADILQNEQFSSSHANDLVVLYLDFPSRKKNKLSPEETKHNEGLAARYNGSGAFPKVILFDANLNKLKDLEFNGQSVENFSAMIGEKRD